MNRFRELVYALAFWAIRSSAFAIVGIRELRGKLVEVDRNQLGPHAKDVARAGSARSSSMTSRMTFESCWLVARILRRNGPSSAEGRKPRLSRNVDAGI